MYDCIIIGAGVIGCAVAREMTRYTPNVCILEKESDVCEGTTKANSAIVHSGYDAVPGSKKAYYNVIGNKLYDALSEDLDIPFKRNGSLVLCFHEEHRAQLLELLRRGEQNGVPFLRIVEKEELREMEPHVTPEAVCALWAPTGGIVCPFTLCIAMAENAATNGASFFFDREVTSVERIDSGFLVVAGENRYEGKTVVNAAGVFADKLSCAAGGMSFGITPRRGEYCVMDKTVGYLVKNTIFQLPGPKGKGVLVTPTIHGNLLVGPNAEDIGDKQDTSTTAFGISLILETAAMSVDKLPQATIASYAGLRAHPKSDDFYVGEDDAVPGLFHAAGIESPGLTAAPAIGVALGEAISKRLGLFNRVDFQGKRRGIAKFSEMDDAQRQEALKRNPAYGNIVCRCETVTEAEVVDAIHRVPGARTLDGVKRRTRCGTGRCQGGFCMPKVSHILSRELDVPMQSITKRGKGSTLFSGIIKEEPCE